LIDLVFKALEQLRERGGYRGIPAFGAMNTISASANSVSESRDLAQT
jgi:hypothetical protein